jgi:hypothetical protein
MRYRSAWLLLLYCAILGAREPRRSSGRVDVYLIADRDVRAGVVQAMEREVEVAVASAGIVVAWHDAFPSGEYERLALLRLHGECRADLPPVSSAHSGSGEPLGQTQMVDGNVLPVADIQCDAVRKLINQGLQAAPTSHIDEMLGRALGRIVAHELYHVLLGTPYHGHEGLARPAQTSAELLAPSARFAEPDQRKLSESVLDRSH